MGMGRVLVVDDDPAVRKSLERILVAAGYEVHVLSSADDAVNSLIGGRRYDAILTDMWMPTAGGDGMGFYYRVRDVAVRQAERMIFVTGGGLPAAMQRFLEGRPVVSKPFDRQSVIAAIEGVSQSKPPQR
jgi:CheY-like chemotaxis protein